MAGSPARKEVGRVGVKVVPDTSGFGADLKSELAKHANTELDIKVEGDFAKFEAELKRITSGKHTVNIDVQADVAAAEAAIARVTQDRTAKLKLDVETSAIDAALAKAQQRLSGVNSRKITLQVDLDSKAAEAKLKSLTRTQTKKIRVDLDTSTFDQAKTLVSDLGSAITTALSGSASLLKDVANAFSSLGSTASSTASAVTSSGSAITGVLGNVSSVAGSIIGTIAQIAGIAVVITGVIALLGSLVVAAGAAVVAMAGVAIGVASLVALPAIFAGVAALLISKSDELKAKFSELGDTLRATVTETAQPMMDALAQAVTRINDAVSEGTPLYDALALAFESASAAVGPLTDGLIAFAENALTGIANALSDLESQGFWDGIAEGLATLGEAFGSFFRSLSTWAPEFEASFQAVADAANILLPAIANLAGAFASFAPDVITGIATAFSQLFDAFAANKDVYGTAAKSLADALVAMAGPIEQVAAAFAQMAPDIMAAVAQAVQTLADALSDPGVVENLTNLATGLIELGTAAAEAAISVSSKVGEMAQSTSEFADLITGKLTETANISNEQLKTIISQAEGVGDAAQTLASQLTISFGTLVSESVGKMRELEDSWQASIQTLIDQGNTGGAQLNEGFRQQFLGLLNTIKTNGTEMDAAWVASMQKLIAATQASGDPLAQSMGQNMQAILTALQQKGPELENQLRTILQGMENQVQASQIAAALGIKLDEAKGQVDSKGQAVQQSFKAVMDALPEMVRSARTPEELQTKLDQMTQIVSGAAPAMGTAFKALGDSMVKGIADADVATATTTLMTSIQTAITSGVPGVVSAFQQLPTQLAAAMSTGSAAVTSAVTTQMTNITQAVTTGVTNAVTAYKKLPTDMASASDFSQTTSKIKEAMETSKQTVTTNVKSMVDELKKLPDAGKEAGKLGGFADAIKSEVQEAQSAVASAVSEIVSQLEQLNRTFTTNIVVNVTRNEEGGEGEANFAPNSFTPDGFAPMLMAAEPVALAAASPLAEQAQAAEAIMTYARAMKAGPQVATDKPTVQKVYNFTINAAPNVPTEEQLRRQLAYADALYE
jgi:hypothetical protein